MVYVTLTPAHGLVMPVIGPGIEIEPLDTTESVLTALLPQLFRAYTVIFPLVEEAITVIEFVVLVPVQPEGKVHTYEVAPDTGGTLYTAPPPAHKVVGPLILLGVVGVVITATLFVTLATQMPVQLIIVSV